MALQTKIIRTMAGALLCPLAVGSRAIIVHQGKIIRTARITAIHHRNAGEVYFEILDIFRLARLLRERKKLCQKMCAMVQCHS